jgi:hypothetical protein
LKVAKQRMMSSTEMKSVTLAKAVKTNCCDSLMVNPVASLAVCVVGIWNA